jgi:hypothetical protein
MGDKRKMPDMNENAETQQEYFGRANASRMSVEEREKTILLQQLSDREKRIAELEEKISVLLSCKNCSENKGGYICQKEYEDKCLAQKIQYIKELKEENAELKEENAELKEQKEMLEKGYVWHDYDAGEDCYEDTHEGKWVKRDEVYQLTKAKEIISEYINILKGDTKNWKKTQEKAEQFIKDSEVEK